MRLWTLLKTASAYRLEELIPAARRPKVLTMLLALARQKAVHANASDAERLRLALESLGPVFIKFGQLLSTRRDLLPDDFADQLARLQDQVPPIDPDIAIRVIEASLGASIIDLFARFDREPLAAASVAQVHSAQLKDGREVVVKVLRPDIEPVIKQDLRLLKRVARVLNRLSPDFRRLRLPEVTADYEQTLANELNLAREAGNASIIRRNFIDSGLVYVPEVHWPMTCDKVMVSERIHGIPVSDIARLNDLNVDLKRLAERGVEIFFTQVFRDSFFHADMHPGNIFVDASDPSDPRYLAVDCAIVGQLDDNDLYYLARNLLAIFQRDYRLVAQLHIECGWIPATTPVAEFEAAIRTLCEPIFERPLSEISFGHMLISLFKTAGQFDMTVQPQLVLLEKTLLNIEGLGRQLYPALNLWDTAQPYLERWLSDRYSPTAVLQRLQKQAPGWLESLPMVPDLLLNRLRADPATPAPPPRPVWAWAITLIGCLGLTMTAIQPDPPLTLAIVSSVVFTFGLVKAVR